MKSNHFLLLFVLIIILLLGIFSTKLNKKPEEITCPTSEKSSTTPTHYTAKSFDLSSIKGLTKDQLDQHKTLYEGYVTKRNEIAHSLTTVDKSNQNRTYAPFRELKIEETYALNGSVLHELYFENLTQPGSKPGPKFLSLLQKSFKSFDAFKADLMASAQASRGWVITTYNLDDHLLHNYVLEAHNQNVPVLALPLLVLDVYEHAYMIDFGIQRTPYLDIFWDNINWNVVEQRISKWVEPLHEKK